MARGRRGRLLHGWLILDKPAGLTSTQALGQVRRLLGASKAGHGGTLDPLATGVLPLAFGEATKTVQFALDGDKEYDFRVRWGVATDTDDATGQMIAHHDRRPARAAVLAALADFVGTIEQRPPAFSAIRVDGERAYDRARAGAPLALPPRPVTVSALKLTAEVDADHADFHLACGKGTYVRALARDLAEKLGTYGHVTSIRRTRSGPFRLADTISLDSLEEKEHNADALLLPLDRALDDIPALDLLPGEVARLRQGQTVPFFTRPALARLEAVGLAGPADTVPSCDLLRVRSDGQLVGLVTLAEGALRVVRLFNLNQNAA